VERLSYSQNLEDIHLQLAFAGQDGGVYVDIGGSHPVADNVTYGLYRRGWSGIVVEPQEELARLHRLLRPRDRVVTELVGREVGTAEFHRVGGFHALSTTVAGNVENARAMGAEVETVSRPMTTLAALFDAHGLTTIDVLKIDVEGAEADVLAGNDWVRFRPKVILAEAIAPGSGEPAWEAWEPLLLEQGYGFQLFDTLNRFYVAQECREIAARLPRERVAWDSATHLYEIGRADSPTHPDHDLARDLARGLWASLPELQPELLARFVLRGRSPGNPDPAELRRLAEEFRSDAGRERLGRIAMGFDGGQLTDE
jgi:FkbM family methyltransferase